VTITAPTFDFEAGEKQKEKNILIGELDKLKNKNLLLENEKRDPLRRKFIFWKVFWWRFRSFIWIIILPSSLLLLYLTFKKYNVLGIGENEKSIDLLLSNTIIKGILWMCAIVFQVVFVAIFASKFFQTNKSKYIDNLDIPEELMNVK